MGNVANEAKLMKYKSIGWDRYPLHGQLHRNYLPHPTEGTLNGCKMGDKNGETYDADIPFIVYQLLNYYNFFHMASKR